MDAFVPDDFDWVTAHNACTPSGMLQVLQRMAETNVQKRTDLGPRRLRFQVESTAANTFVVSAMELHSPQPQMAVKFRALPDRIGIEGFGLSSQFEAIPVLNPDGSCRLEVDGNQLAPWQVLRMALTHLLFNA